VAATTAHSPVVKPAPPAPQRRVNQLPASGASLIAAIKRGATDQARALLRAGADANARDAVAGQSADSAPSALLLALSWRADAKGRLQPPPENLPLIGALLSKGANPNSADADGVTPLLLAAQLHYTETVRQLLRHGARVNVRDKDGRIPLSYAVESSDPNLLKTLLNRGADVNARAFGDNTPLMFAVLAGNEANVKELLHRRAKLDLTNSAGQTALSIATSHGNARIVAILKAATPKGSR
jgi:ankyrin repeat protein